MQPGIGSIFGQKTVILKEIGEAVPLWAELSLRVNIESRKLDGAARSPALNRRVFRSH